MNYFSGNIRFLRNKRGLSQAEMMDSLGFPRTTWSSYENGVSQPGIDGILRIASFFGISVTELLEEDLTQKDYLFFSRSSETPLEKKILAEGTADYKKTLDKAERLLGEIVKAKQEVIDTQAKTIHALQALVEQLSSDLIRYRDGKE
ncbi:MAG: helix-turn-helix transcriptional regulator [Prolixibacteraceae bacterium]